MSQSVPFGNKYEVKTATRESPCWVCGKFTTTVFTHKDLDFFYVCPGHLTDTQFCKPFIPTPLAPVQAKSAPPPVKKDKISEEKQQSFSQQQSKDGSDNDGKNAEVNDGEQKSSAETKSSQAQKVTDKSLQKDKGKNNKSPTPAPQPVKIKEYILDQKLFYMRESQYRKKMAAKAAKKVYSQLPSVPRNQLPKRQDDFL
ncbi:hypothetical protein MP228_010359 [Amoeboaphelidium protococcarum]|nr:hypothetical protein MP228_010359 [Amoeboaphelidium protococcarum]